MCLWTEKQGKDANKKKDGGSKNKFKKHGGKEDRDKSEKTEKVKVQLEQEPLQKNDEAGHYNINVVITEQQEKRTVDGNKKRKKEKRTGSQRKKLKALILMHRKFLCVLITSRS